MNFPAELKYSRDHEWVKMLDDTTALVGITDFAQSELGDLVYVNLPEPGDEVLAGETACDVESVKAVSDVMSPVTGVIAEVNEELMDAPEKLNEEQKEALKRFDDAMKGIAPEEGKKKGFFSKLKEDLKNE